MDKIIKNIKPNKDKVGFLRYGKLKDKFLVTNDIGRYALLEPDDFKKFIEGKLDKKGKIYRELQEKHFVKDDLDVETVIDVYRQRNAFLFQGASLHIVAITLRCNYNCIYCQATSRNLKSHGYDMNRKTARAVVKTIFQTPNPNITIEFQGGEPLVNWPIIKFIVEEAEKKNLKAKKKMMITIVTNLSLMDEEKYKYIMKHNISVCTSLDGPEKLHNLNRPFAKSNSYEATTSWIRKFREREKDNPSVYRISALVTISPFSLKYPREIVDEYLKWGFKTIHLRPMSMLGQSSKFKKPVGSSADEFMEFWQKAMDYIIELNLKNKFITERGCTIMLRKILGDVNQNFLDLRSPCGAGIGQMLYNYDGKVFTCDEARMLSDDTFIIGKISKNNYKQLISHPNVRATIQASILENSACDNCVYKPYCGVCPVINYSVSGTLFPDILNTDWHKTHKGRLDYLFEKLQDKKIMNIFQDWIKGKQG
jgi:His-Xaa-Ser system radical SAM maturase HxsB